MQLKKEKKKTRVKSKEIRSQEIQDAARKVFFKKGYQKSTISEIARQAGIREGTVYLYFKNKEDLYISLMTPTVLRLGEQLKQIEENLREKKIKTGAALMNGLIQAHFNLYEYDPEGLRIIEAFLQSNLFPGISKKIQTNLNNLAKSNYQTLRRIIVTAKEKGFFKKNIDEYPLADIVWILFIGTIMVEENKLRFTQKDHIRTTIQYGYSLIAQAVLENASSFEVQLVPHD